jgi:DMSO/TMAO reductase YedYZ molybdopterin-dependent catalytic subunit
MKTKMRLLNINALLLLGIIVIIAGCSPEAGNPGQTHETYQWNGIRNAITPTGEKLQPAEKGPVRSALGEPVINFSDFKLEIAGLVDSSYNLSLIDILSLPETQTDTLLMYCVEGWEVWGVWQGISVKGLLDEARVKPEGKYVLFTCADGYSTCLPLSYLENYNIILAYNVNGSPLKTSDGYPLRLISFGKFGYKWAKWVSRLKVIDMYEYGYWESRGYSDDADVEIERRRYYEGENAKPLDY